MRQSPARLARLAILLTLLAAQASCGTDIGDSCLADSECGEGRRCDRSSRGGYCTVSPCGPNSCPENSTCVRFENDQTWCMATCDNGDDCRGGYTCTDELSPVKYCRQSNRH